MNDQSAFGTFTRKTKMTPITLETYPGSRKKGLINLIECGYNTLEMVSETDDDVLLRYRNVGPILIADLRKMAMDHGIQITGKPTKPSYKRLERENAALRADNAAAHALVLYLRSKEYAERTLAVKLEKENAALRAALDNLRTKIADAAKDDCRKLHEFERIALAMKEAQP